jgi:hypothetical protein
MIFIHAGDVDAADVGRQQPVEHGLVQQVAVGLHHEFRRPAPAVVETSQRVEEKFRPDEYLAAGQDDAVEGDVLGPGEVADACRHLVASQPVGPGLGVVVAVGAALVAVARHHPVDRFHGRSSRSPAGVSAG